MMTLAMAADPGSMDVHDPARPIALGSRAGVWTGPYSAPMVGGHIKIAASEKVGLEGFSDHTLLVRDGVARHDHILGFHAYTPALLGAERWFVSPTIGACVDFRIDSPTGDRASRAPSTTDVLFGTHAGGMAEIALGRGWSLETTATGFLYFGNATGPDEGGAWRAGASNQLKTSAVAQVLGSINYRL
jgi:hypothetical protein